MTEEVAPLIDYQIPEHRISIKVDHGHVTLTGSVDWAYERQAAVDAVLKIAGVLSVDNQVTLTPPHASATEIQRGIARAFARKLPDDQNPGHPTDEQAWICSGIASTNGNDSSVG